MHRLKILLFLFVLLSIPALQSQAAGRGHTTRRSGLVQTVDSAKHTFTFLPDGEAKPVAIEWRVKSGVFTGQKTEFFAGDAPASNSILKAGIRVQVRYEEALFTPNRAVLVRSLKQYEKGAKRHAANAVTWEALMKGGPVFRADGKAMSASVVWRQ